MSVERGEVVETSHDVQDCDDGATRCRDSSRTAGGASLDADGATMVPIPIIDDDVDDDLAAKPAAAAEPAAEPDTLPHHPHEQLRFVSGESSEMHLPVRRGISRARPR